MLVEDEVSLRETLKKLFEAEGYYIDACDNGMDGLDYALCTDYDAIILDIMLPKLDGISVLQKIRQKKKNAPILLLTALDSVSDKVSGLDSGADDYLVKPFAFQELLARVRVLVRHSARNASNILQIDDLVMDCTKRIVTRAGVTITLTNKEYAVLEFLLRNKNVVISKEKIEQHICDYSYNAETNVVKVYIRYLRKKIDEGHERKLIHTVRNFGYVIRIDGDETP